MLFVESLSNFYRHDKQKKLGCAGNKKIGKSRKTPSEISPPYFNKRSCVFPVSAPAVVFGSYSVINKYLVCICAFLPCHQHSAHKIVVLASLILVKAADINNSRLSYCNGRIVYRISPLCIFYNFLAIISSLSFSNIFTCFSQR